MGAALLSGPILPGVMLLLALLAAIPGLVSFVRSRQAADEVAKRLVRRSPEAADEPRRNESRIGRAVMGLADNAAPAEGQEVNAVRAKLNQAGYYQKNAVSRYFFARFVCVVIPQVGLFFALPYMSELPKYAPVMASIILVLAGLAAPGKVLDMQIEKRRQA
jgi:tight adherence protein C